MLVGTNEVFVWEETDVMTLKLFMFSKGKEQRSLWSSKLPTMLTMSNTSSGWVVW